MSVMCGQCDAMTVTSPAARHHQIILLGYRGTCMC